MPISRRYLLVAEAENSGPPSEVSSSGIPKLLNVDLNLSIRPAAPFPAFSMIGHPEYLSTMTRYDTPLYVK